ncbi:MAG TPA: sigma-70 family RNA polymerase sigma factor, partial [Prosthecobacter sp.]|nr:sigma-70 family RNA polymerase sigma factor [Prosthecobacter sp.]
MSTDRTETLVLLLTRHQEALFRYVFSLLPSEADARDVLQEASLALCRKFDQYEADKPFLPWACRFAWLEILKHRERARQRPAAFSPDVLELLSDERAMIEPELEARLRALDGCLAKLPAVDRDLVANRYHQRHSAEEMMERLNMSRRTLFRNLERIRRQLFECV